MDSREFRLLGQSLNSITRDKIEFGEGGKAQADKDSNSEQERNTQEKKELEGKVKAQAEKVSNLEQERNTQEKIKLDAKENTERKKNKKTKKALAISLSVLALAVGIFFLFTKMILPEKARNDSYLQAEELLKQKKYDDAIKAFKALGNYKDSATRVDEANEAKKADKEAKNADDYLKAEKLLNEKKYDQAAKAFEALGDYRDSKALMNEAVDAQNAIDYSTAEALFKSKQYDKAFAAFKALGDYKDSSARATEILEVKSKASISVGKTLTFGSYEQDNNLSNGKEPIEWIVLEKQGKKALLISKHTIDHNKYNDLWKDVTWETCTLRSWLNDEFFKTAFSSEEQKAILTTTVDNSKAQGNSEWYTDGGNDTEDKIFLLSYQEANSYFPTDNSRKCTDYQGRLAFWRLRSPGVSQTIAVIVDTFGQFNTTISVSDDFGDPRPVLWVDIEKMV